MEEEEKVEGDTLVTEGERETPTETPTENVVDKEEYLKKLEAYEAQKKRAEKAEAELKKLKSQPTVEVDSVDLIKLGKKLQDYSDDELDFVVDYAKSKKPEAVLKALENPYVQAGIEAQRKKVEKEKSLKPSGTQAISDKPKSLAEEMNSADMAKKEELLKKYGLYKDPRPRIDGKRIG